MSNSIARVTDGELVAGNLPRIILLIAIGLTANIPVSIVGVLKVGEIIALTFTALNFSRFQRFLIWNVTYRKISLSLVMWLVLGLASSWININSTPELYSFIDPRTAVLKGVANIAFIFACFTTFVILLAEHPRSVAYFLVAYGIGSLWFSPFQYTLEDAGRNSFFTVGGVGSVDNYFDMYLSPILTPIIMAFAVAFGRRISFVVVGVLAYGLIAVYFDAKSTGFVFVLAALTMIVKRFGRVPSKKAMLLLLVISPTVVLSGLVFLAELNLLGSSGGKQIMAYLSRSEKFNPFLVIGRPDPTIAIFAILDSPVLGHGFNKQDNRYVFEAKSHGYLPTEYSSRYKGIASHSNLLNAMIEGGIVAGWTFCLLLVVSYRCFVDALHRPVTDLTVIIFIGFYFFAWNILFSGTLRIDLAFFVGLMVHYINTYMLVGQASFARWSKVIAYR